MSSLRVYIVTRILAAIPMVFILLTIVFVVMRVLPGDPVAAIVGTKAPPHVVEALKKQLGLDKPLIIQYLNYIWQLLHGDLGRSMIWGRRPVICEIMDRFPATLELSIFSFLISVLIGVVTGVYAAQRFGRPADHALRLYGIITYSLFIPWFGMILQLIFGVYLGWLPVGGRIDTYMEPKHITGLYVLDSILTFNMPSLISALRHLALPSITLGIYISGIFTRIVRSSMINVLRRDFIRAARARGIPERLVIYRHALKNAFIPVLTMMGLQFALLLAGAVLTETTFSWPGMGTLLVERILYRDFVTVQGTIVFIAVLIITVGLIVDILYAYLDPRIRLR
ncbi:MAG: ABC transporter permease [Thaumarchaeota archaeon]|nr:MAG: ABC transporter permease [Nitrososphaerota archaeon]